MKNSKVDGNQAEIVEALEKLGCHVQSMAAIGKGCPDLLVSFRNRWLVMEVKNGDGKLNVAQEAWAKEARAPVYVVYSPIQALEICGMVAEVKL